MKYEGAESDRRGWGDWQPETRGDAVFALGDLQVTAGENVPFGYGFIRCGGALPDGKTFQDVVRATFCLKSKAGRWVIKHQHVSKPFQGSG